MKHAFIWHCDDEVCDCYQPQIVEYCDVPFGNPLWIPPRYLEEGPFFSEPTSEDWKEIHTWMLEAARRHQVDNLSDIEKKYA